MAQQIRTVKMFCDCHGHTAVAVVATVTEVVMVVNGDGYKEDKNVTYRYV